MILFYHIVIKAFQIYVYHWRFGIRTIVLVFIYRPYYISHNFDDRQKQWGCCKLFKYNMYIYFILVPLLMNYLLILNFTHFLNLIEIIFSSIILNPAYYVQNSRGMYVIVKYVYYDN